MTLWPRAECGLWRAIQRLMHQRMLFTPGAAETGGGQGGLGSPIFLLGGSGPPNNFNLETICHEADNLFIYWSLIFPLWPPQYYSCSAANECVKICYSNWKTNIIFVICDPRNIKMNLWQVLNPKFPKRWGNKGLKWYGEMWSRDI